MHRTLLIALILPLAGCEGLNNLFAPAPSDVQQQAAESARRQAEARQNEPQSRVVAIVEGKPVSQGQMQPLLFEASGGDVLGELVLDEQIASDLRKADLTITDDDIRSEREILLRRLSDDPDQATRLLEALRERLRLGPRRFHMFLQRYAALRKLIADQVNVTDAMIRAAYEQGFAQQTVCRLILVPTLLEANRALRRIDAGESFMDLAIELSQDSSRNQGGLLPPISPLDPTYPTAISKAAMQLQPGDVSNTIVLDDGFAILKCEEKIDVDTPPYEQVADDLRNLVRLEQERSLMQRRARVLMQEADVTVLDATLDKEFQKRRRETINPVE